MKPAPCEPSGLPRAVLFDWDNTLVDNWGCIHAALNAALTAHGLAPWTYEETRARVRRSLRDSFPELFGARWQEARDIFYAHFEANHLEHLRPLPGAEALLQALARKGIYLAVVSNKTGRFLRAEAAALGWSGYFGALVGAGDAEADKPAPAPVHLALRPSGLVPGREVWFIGDADVDMQCARAAKCVPVLVGSACTHEMTVAPAHQFENCLALCSLVRRLGDTISLGAMSGS